MFVLSTTAFSKACTALQETLHQTVALQLKAGALRFRRLRVIAMIAVCCVSLVHMTATLKSEPRGFSSTRWATINLARRLRAKIGGQLAQSPDSTSTVVHQSPERWLDNSGEMQLSTTRSGLSLASRTEYLVPEQQFRVLSQKRPKKRKGARAGEEEMTVLNRATCRTLTFLMAGRAAEQLRTRLHPP